jgi:hypothetical protein
MGGDKFTECEDAYWLIGRAVVMLKEAQQPVTNSNIRLMLQADRRQNDDVYLAQIYDIANILMGQKN